MKRSLLTLALIASAALAAVVAQTLPAGVQKGPSMGGITEYDFPNGLKVLLYPDASEPKITVNVTYLVGSRHEGYGETGMAHLLEHMNFIETTNGRKIKDELVAHGANWNGTTSDDRTNYYETFTASDDNLRWALGLEADRMVNVKFTKEILDTEMTVVRNEFERGENNPASILRERVASTAYLWHNYGKSTIGSKEDIEKVPVQPPRRVLQEVLPARRCRARHYGPDRRGEDPADGRGHAGQAAAPDARPRPDLHGGAAAGRRAVRRRCAASAPARTVIVAFHAVSASHPDAATLQVLAGVMNGSGGGGRGGRGGGGGGGATKGGSRRRSWTPSSPSPPIMSFQQLHDPGLVDGDRDAQPGSVARCRARRHLQGARRRRQEPADTRGSRSRADADAAWSRKQPVESAGHRHRRAQYRHRTGRLAAVVPRSTIGCRTSCRRISFGSPRSTSSRRIAPSATTCRIPRPSGRSCPLRRTSSRRSRTTRARSTVARGESFDPTIPNIASRVVSSTLDNGMKLSVLKKQTATNMVTATIDLRFGDADIARGPARRGDIRRQPADGGHEDAHAAADSGRVAQAQRAGERRAAAEAAEAGAAAAAAEAVAAASAARRRQHFGAGRELRRGGEARGRDPEGAGVSAGRLRSRQDTAAEGARGRADRAESARQRTAQSPSEPVREGRPAVHADARGAGRADFRR